MKFQAVSLAVVTAMTLRPSVASLVGDVQKYVDEDVLPSLVLPSSSSGVVNGNTTGSIRYRVGSTALASAVCPFEIGSGSNASRWGVAVPTHLSTGTYEKQSMTVTNAAVVRSDGSAYEVVEANATLVFVVNDILLSDFDVVSNMQLSVPSQVGKCDSDGICDCTQVTGTVSTAAATIHAEVSFQVLFSKNDDSSIASKLLYPFTFRSSTTSGVGAVSSNLAASTSGYDEIMAELATQVETSGGAFDVLGNLSFVQTTTLEGFYSSPRDVVKSTWPEITSTATADPLGTLCLDSNTKSQPANSSLEVNLVGGALELTKKTLENYLDMFTVSAFPLPRLIINVFELRLVEDLDIPLAVNMTINVGRIISPNKITVTAPGSTVALSVSDMTASLGSVEFDLNGVNKQEVWASNVDFSIPISFHELIYPQTPSCAHDAYEYSTNFSSTEPVQNFTKWESNLSQMIVPSSRVSISMESVDVLAHCGASTVTLMKDDFVVFFYWNCTNQYSDTVVPAQQPYLSYTAKLTTLYYPMTLRQAATAQGGSLDLALGYADPDDSTPVNLQVVYPSDLKYTAQDLPNQLVWEQDTELIAAIATIAALYETRQALESDEELNRNLLKQSQKVLTACRWNKNVSRMDVIPMVYKKEYVDSTCHGFGAEPTGGTSTCDDGESMSGISNRHTLGWQADVLLTVLPATEAIADIIAKRLAGVWDSQDSVYTKYIDVPNANEDYVMLVAERWSSLSKENLTKLFGAHVDYTDSRSSTIFRSVGSFNTAMALDWGLGDVMNSAFYTLHQGLGDSLSPVIPAIDGTVTVRSKAEQHPPFSYVGAQGMGDCASILARYPEHAIDAFNINAHLISWTIKTSNCESDCAGVQLLADITNKRLGVEMAATTTNVPDYTYQTYLSGVTGVVTQMTQLNADIITFYEAEDDVEMQIQQLKLVASSSQIIADKHKLVADNLLAKVQSLYTVVQSRNLSYHDNLNLLEASNDDFQDAVHDYIRRKKEEAKWEFWTGIAVGVWHLTMGGWYAFSVLQSFQAKIWNLYYLESMMMTDNFASLYDNVYSVYDAISVDPISDTDKDDSQQLMSVVAYKIVFSMYQAMAFNDQVSRIRQDTLQPIYGTSSLPYPTTDVYMTDYDAKNVQDQNERNMAPIFDIGDAKLTSAGRDLLLQQSFTTTSAAALGSAISSYLQAAQAFSTSYALYHAQLANVESIQATIDSLEQELDMASGGNVVDHTLMQADAIMLEYMDSLCSAWRFSLNVAQGCGLVDIPALAQETIESRDLTNTINTLTNWANQVTNFPDLPTSAYVEDTRRVVFFTGDNVEEENKSNWGTYYFNITTQFNETVIDNDNHTLDWTFDCPVYQNPEVDPFWDRQGLRINNINVELGGTASLRCPHGQSVDVNALPTIQSRNTTSGTTLTYSMHAFPTTRVSQSTSIVYGDNFSRYSPFTTWSFTILSGNGCNFDQLGNITVTYTYVGQAAKTQVAVPSPKLRAPQKPFSKFINIG
mmetsp:Transcript_3553/g.7693  ORF Transcript_3553/g.7693 Transcript_3553/m.7693 type:complete len:1501 (-) Transcript_3553:1708-6210(-)